MTMTYEEMLPRFQELCAPCYFCGAKHTGEGYSEQRMQDVIDGIEPWIGRYLCPTCRPRLEEMNAHDRARQTLHRNIETMRELGLFDFDPKYKLAKVLEDVRAANPEVLALLDVETLDQNLWLFGGVGLGKSHLCRCVGNRYVSKLKTVASITGPKFRNIAEEWGLSQAALVKRYEDADLLIIDDIDKALVWTMKSLESFWSIMDTRERTQRRTLINSQNTPEQFFETIDKVAGSQNLFSLSLLDRLKPLAVFEMKGDSRRG